MSDTEKQVKDKQIKEEPKKEEDSHFQKWIDDMGDKMIESVTWSSKPIPCNSSGGGNLEYDNALRKWKNDTEEYWKARNHAKNTGGVFLAVEPPPRPDYADYV